MLFDNSNAICSMQFFTSFSVNNLNLIFFIVVPQIMIKTINSLVIIINCTKLIYFKFDKKRIYIKMIEQKLKILIHVKFFFFLANKY